MQFKLVGRIELSKNVGEAEEVIENFLKEAETTVLAKGAPEGLGPKIIKWTFDKQMINIEIESGTHVRAHEALLRLKKNIGMALGKKYKMGARSVFIDEYVIDIELAQEHKEEFTVPFVESLKFGEKSCKLIFKDLDEEFIEKNYIDRIINLINKKVEDQYYEGKAEYWELIWKSDEIEPIWTEDPTEEMAKRHWIKQGPTKGKWFYKP